MVCNFCKSERLYLRESDGKTGLYCKDCGRWLKWVSPADKAVVQMQLEKQRREIRIDGADVERAVKSYKACRQKYQLLRDEIASSKNIVAKSGSKIGKSALYSKVLRLRDLGVRIETCRELFLVLGLKQYLP